MVPNKQNGSPSTMDAAIDEGEEQSRDIQTLGLRIAGISRTLLGAFSSDMSDRDVSEFVSPTITREATIQRVKQLTDAEEKPLGRGQSTAPDSRTLIICPENLEVVLFQLRHGLTTDLLALRLVDGLVDDDLIEILGSLGNNQSIRTISINNCPDLTSLPSWFPECLNRLEIDNARSLIELPAVLPRYLRNLAVTYATSLVKLPDTLPHAIRSLDLTGCKNLVALPQPLPSKLMELITVDCPKIGHVDWAVPHSVNWLRNVEPDGTFEHPLGEELGKHKMPVPAGQVKTPQFKDAGDFLEQ